MAVAVAGVHSHRCTGREGTRDRRRRRTHRARFSLPDYRVLGLIDLVSLFSSCFLVPQGLLFTTQGQCPERILLSAFPHFQPSSNGQ